MELSRRKYEHNLTLPSDPITAEMADTKPNNLPQSAIGPHTLLPPFPIEQWSAGTEKKIPLSTI